MPVSSKPRTHYVPIQTMAPPTDYLELACPACGWCELCGPAEMCRWLARLGKVRRGREPAPEILVEVFRGTAGQMTCPECGRQGLTTAAAREETANWGEPVTCEACSRPISRERLQAVPGAKLCAACQAADEKGRGEKAVEYCPRCGAVMELRPTRGAGVARYVMVCTADPPCRL